MISDRFNDAYDPDYDDVPPSPSEYADDDEDHFAIWSHLFDGLTGQS